MGKAGSGKDTILHKVVSDFPDLFHEIISCTTRPIREGEKEGVNYFYLTREEFEKKVCNHEMLEITEFRGWYYGAAKSSLSKDKINIGVFDPAGVYSLMKDPDIQLKVYYAQAGDKTRLMRQLQRETNPDIKEIIRRFQTDENDFSDLHDIPYIRLQNETPTDLNSISSYIVTYNKFI